MFVGTVDQGSRGAVVATPSRATWSFPAICSTRSPVTAASRFFDALSHSHRKHWVRWVQEAERAETRGARINRAAEHPPGREPGDLGHKRTV